MSRVKRPGLVAVLALLVCGCGDDEADAVYARLSNETELDFIRLSIGGVFELGPFPAGATSAYQKTEAGFLYPLEVGEAESTEYRFFGMLTDRVGDVPLENGHYTYDVSAGLDREYFPGWDGSILYQVE